MINDMGKPLNAKQPEIEMIIDQINVNLEELEGAFNRLNERLNTVQGNPPPTTTEKSKKMSYAINTVLGKLLEVICNKIDKVTENMDSLTDRIEI